MCNIVDMRDPVIVANFGGIDHARAYGLPPAQKECVSDE
jgi:hypothetical protein